MRLILILFAFSITTIVAKRHPHKLNPPTTNNNVNVDKYCTSAPDKLKKSGMISVWAFFDPTDDFLKLQVKKFVKIAMDYGAPKKGFPPTQFYAIVPDPNDYGYKCSPSILSQLRSASTVISDKDFEIEYDFKATKDHVIIVNSCGLVREQFIVDWKAPGLNKYIRDVILKVHNNPCNCPWGWPTWGVE